MASLKKLRQQIIIDGLIFCLTVIIPLWSMILFKISVPPRWFPYLTLLLLFDCLIFALLLAFHIRELRRRKERDQN